MKLLWYRLVHKMRKPDLFSISYRGCVSPREWTFPEATKFMRAIPVTDSCELLSERGTVHFTLPPRKG